MKTVNWTSFSIASTCFTGLSTEEALNRVVSVVLDFSQDTVYQINLWDLWSRDIIRGVKAVYLDASNTASAVSLSVPGFQTITVKSHTQGYYPLLVSYSGNIQVSSSDATLKLLLSLTNVEIQSAQWATQ